MPLTKTNYLLGDFFGERGHAHARKYTLKHLRKKDAVLLRFFICGGATAAKVFMGI
jgi:hypothetical protein